MNILYVSQYFPPEMGAPAARAAELAHHWAEAGHQVSVLTGFPNHPTGLVPEEWRPRLRRLVYHETVDHENGGRVDVYRTWLWPLPNRKSHERMRNYASFCVSAALRGLTLPRPDVIIATSPQLLVGLAGWWLGFSRQVPFVFEVRDLWPESLTAVGVGNEDSLLHHTLAAIAGFLYEKADRIVVVTPAFKEYLIERWHVPAERIAIVENGVEADLFAPAAHSSTEVLRRELGAESRFLVCYIGTMGNAHGLETLLAAAARLQIMNSNVLFLLIGEGAEKERIKALAESRALANVRFLDQQPRETIPAFISASDACLVLLKKTDVFKTVIPTKMLEFMSCARPVILGVDGQARQIVEEAGAGIAIEPENSEALVEVITHLESNRGLGPALGQNGRNYILQNFARARTAEKYVQILESIVRATSG
ncbi:MAG TPA: glycosyltransferase family 4 protein [Candidatus Dormibacteraeota bacterium]|nr:glycosyltransferase family 4 protein [Candidatus Dormibacteraeota bacterium]